MLNCYGCFCLLLCPVRGPTSFERLSLSLSLSLPLSLHLSIYVTIYLSMYLSIYLSISLYVYLYICVYIYIYIYIYTYFHTYIQIRNTYIYIYITHRYIICMRTNGVNTKLGKKVRPGTFGKKQVGQREYPKGPSVKKHDICSDSIGADPIRWPHLDTCLTPISRTSKKGT